MQYHVAKNGEKSGPFEKEEVYRRLVSGELSGSDLGWCEGMAEWEPLSKLIPPQTPPIPSSANKAVFASSAIRVAGPLPNTKTSGMAVASMICGILGLLLWLPCIPAVILGHLGLSAIKKSAGALKGGGMAVTGLVTGYLMIAAIPIIAILASLAVPVFSSIQQKATRVKAMSQGKQLVIAMKQYATEHEGKLPPSLETLVEEQYVDQSLLTLHPLAQGTHDYDQGQGWEYRGAGLKDSAEADTIVLISRKADRRGERIVARLDGTVEVERGDKIPSR
jgi:type II secretory pathway pseudopilin PulG